MKQQWVVRVINPIPMHDPVMPRSPWVPLHGAWSESLRYMGYLTVVKEYDGKDGYEVVDISAPRGLDSKSWADSNAARMRTMGINAAAAPEWKNGTKLEIRM